MPPKNKNSQAITQESSNIPTKSKRSPLKLESDIGLEWYSSIFQNFLKLKNIKHYSRFTDKGPSVAERIIRTVSNLFKKPVFEKENADWLSELPVVIKRYNNTIDNSTKLQPIEAGKNINEKVVYNNLKGNREVQKPKPKLGQLIRTAEI